MANSEANVTVGKPAVLIAVLMKIQTFCSVTRCGLENSYGHFRGAKFRDIPGDFISVCVKFVLIELKSF
jgi:hypothetical protein